MVPILPPPSDYPRIKVVDSFEELIGTAWGDGVNALCWPRVLEGDFAEVAEQLMGCGEGITGLDEDRLRRLTLGQAGRAAVEVMLEDLRCLRELGLGPELNSISNYPREEKPGAVRTDVYSFHADSAPVAADTWLCTYHGAPSEGLRNDQGRRRIDDPFTRAALLEEAGGKDDAAFLEYLEECCYHLHYAPVEQAQPFSFGLGNLWRIAVEYPGSPVPPCIHRAPDTVEGQLPRLLLIC